MAFNDYRGGGSPRPQFEDKSEVKPAVEIKSFYKSGTDIPLEDLFDEQAQKIAESFVGKNKKGFEIGVSSTQLRRIFDEVKRYERVLLGTETKWEEQLPYIKMIKSKVAYTVARASKTKPEEKGVYKNLEEFISSGINLIKTEKDYHIFVSLFEAVYGFYYEKAPKSAN
jgi:CRISPR-associated protein Csm2